MRKIGAIALVTITLFPVITIAQELEFFKGSMFYQGKVDFQLKEEYAAGETLETTITVTNLEAFPIFDGYLIIQLIEGCKEPIYPTSEGECNLLYEEKIEGISMLPMSEKSIKWSYKLPTDLKNGDYRVDVYFKTERTPIVGMPTIFTAPIYETFKLTGGGDFPGAKISWKKTHVAGGYAQSGPGVLPRSEVEGAVFIKATHTFKGNLNVKVCSYDDTACNSFLIQRSYPVEVSAGEEKPVLISFTAPDKPDAYAIRLELVDDKERLNSLYRSRIVVLGEGARIMKLAISKPYYKSGEEGWIRVLATGPLFYSPVLPSVSEVKNVKLNVYLSKDGKEIFKDSTLLPSIRTDELVAKEFRFTAVNNMDRVNVCAELTNGIVYDRYCYLTTYELPVKPVEKPIVPISTLYLSGILILITIAIVVVAYKRWKR